MANQFLITKANARKGKSKHPWLRWIDEFMRDEATSCYRHYADLREEGIQCPSHCYPSTRPTLENEKSHRRCLECGCRLCHWRAPSCRYWVVDETRVLHPSSTWERDCYWKEAPYPQLKLILYLCWTERARCVGKIEWLWRQLCKLKPKQASSGKRKKLGKQWQSTAAMPQRKEMDMVEEWAEQQFRKRYPCLVSYSDGIGRWYEIFHNQLRLLQALRILAGLPLPMQGMILNRAVHPATLITLGAECHDWCCNSDNKEEPCHREIRDDILYDGIGAIYKRVFLGAAGRAYQ